MQDKTTKPNNDNPTIENIINLEQSSVHHIKSKDTTTREIMNTHPGSLTLAILQIRNNLKV